MSLTKLELDKIRERDKEPTLRIRLHQRAVSLRVDYCYDCGGIWPCAYEMLRIATLDRHSLLQHIDELEARIAELEQQLRTVTLIDKMAEEGYEHVEQFEIADTAL